VNLAVRLARDAPRPEKLLAERGGRDGQIKSVDPWWIYEIS
jgi:hypothetical protein